MNLCAKALKKIRKALYLSQAELAELLDISTPSICKYEQSLTIPRMANARKIKLFADKKGIKIKIGDLVGGKQ